MTADLATLRCEACAPGTLPNPSERNEELAKQLDPGWELDRDHIRRSFTLKTFQQAFDLASKVAVIAEEEGHHPDLELGWGYLNVILKTHVAKGLTDNDFIMAAKIDAVA